MPKNIPYESGQHIELDAKQIAAVLAGRGAKSPDSSQDSLTERPELSDTPIIREPEGSPEGVEKCLARMTELDAEILRIENLPIVGGTLYSLEQNLRRLHELRRELKEHQAHCG